VQAGQAEREWERVREGKGEGGREEGKTETVLPSSLHGEDDENVSLLPLQQRVAKNGFHHVSDEGALKSGKQ
jgi:hypothetical protein